MYWRLFKRIVFTNIKWNVSFFGRNPYSLPSVVECLQFLLDFTLNIEKRSVKTYSQCKSYQILPHFHNTTVFFVKMMVLLLLTCNSIKQNKFSLVGHWMLWCGADRQNACIISAGIHIIYSLFYNYYLLILVKASQQRVLMLLERNIQTLRLEYIELFYMPNQLESCVIFFSSFKHAVILFMIQWIGYFWSCYRLENRKKNWPACFLWLHSRNWMVNRKKCVNVSETYMRYALVSWLIEILRDEDNYRYAGYLDWKCLQS